MKYILILFLIISPCVFAQEVKKEAPTAPPVAAVIPVDVPQLTFAQKVDIVVTAKKDPRVLDVRIEQDKQKITIDVVVDKNQDREEAEELAATMILQVKSKSLDDPLKDKKEPGKGLYDYQANYRRSDGVALLTALKPAKDTKIRFENPMPQMPSEIPVDAIDQ